MSQIVGSTFRSRIPTFNDDASIEEALRVYHYGVDNYSTQPIPDDSIEGNFRTLTNNLNTEIASAVKRVSLTSSPNIITSQATNVVPITVRAIASQTTSLQIWQNSSLSSLAEINTSGRMFLTGTLAIGLSTMTTAAHLFVNQASASRVGIIIRGSADLGVSNLQEWQDNLSNMVASVDAIGNIATTGHIAAGNAVTDLYTTISSKILYPSNKGITIRAASGQTANLQEWQNSSGVVLSRVDKDGNLYINETEVFSGGTVTSLMLMGG